MPTCYFYAYLMKYSYFLSFLILIGCVSSPKQQEESSQIASDTVVEANEQHYFSKNVENEILLRKAMVDALQKIADSFHGEDWEYTYDFDKGEGDTPHIRVDIKVQKYFEETYYAVIYVSDYVNTLVRLYRIDHNAMQEKLSKYFSWMTVPSDTIFDANGDKVKDFALRFYPSSGCCRRDIYYLYLSPEKKEGQLSYIELINPTFYPKEHLIRGIGYGRPGHVELYKYRWHGEGLDVLDTLEYILPDMATKGKTFLKAKRIRDFYDTAKGKEIRLTKLPKEYQTVIDLDYFLDYTAEDFNSD